MSTLAASLLLSVLTAAEAKPTPKLPLGKETTYVLGPLDKEGFIDYETALNELLRKKITPKKNANVLLWKALGPTPEGKVRMPAEYFRWMGMQEPPLEGSYFIGIAAFLKEYFKQSPRELEACLAAFPNQFEATWDRQWSEKEYPHIAAWLKANEKPLAMVVQATRLPEYYNPLIIPPSEKERTGLYGALLPTLQPCRRLGACLASRAMLRVGERKLEAAWQDLLACHRLGRLVARGASGIEGLVGLSIDWRTSFADIAYLAYVAQAGRQVREYLKDLQALPPIPAMADKIDVTDRISLLNTLQVFRRRGVVTLLLLEGKPARPLEPRERKALEMIDWGPAFRTANRWYDKAGAVLRLKTRKERERELGKIDEELKTLRKDAASQVQEYLPLLHGLNPNGSSKALSDHLIPLMMPAFRKLQPAWDRGEQIERNLHVAFALAAYQRDRGRYPATLAELRPKYLAAIPDDLFSGKPLIFRPSEKGYLLYSVGVNGADEGGRTGEEDPPGDDLRVRMPLPELKRKK